MGRALLLPLLLYALSSTVLATGLSDDFVPWDEGSQDTLCYIRHRVSYVAGGCMVVLWASVWRMSADSSSRPTALLP